MASADEHPRIYAPTPYIVPHAVSFGAADGGATVVNADAPLPMRARMLPATAQTLAGSIAASAEIGPFAPELGRPIWVTLSGDWAGTAMLLRSVDGGATRLPLTIGGQAWASFAANANEPVVEETDAAASYYLSVALTGGTLAYRVAQ